MSDKDVHTFLVTDSTSADKITKSARLEEMRFTILTNLLKYHPEAGSKMGGVWGERARRPLTRLPTERPLGARKLCVLLFRPCLAHSLICPEPGQLPAPSRCVAALEEIQVGW